MHQYFDPKPPLPYPDFLRKYEEYRGFWEWAWQTFPELAEQLARDLQAPDVPALEPLGGRCPCCNAANRPVGVWLSEDGRIVPAPPLGQPYTIHRLTQIHAD
jgi:hypothetical protein